MTIGRIDASLEASLEAWPEDENEPRDTGLATVGLVSEVAGVLSGVYEHFRVKTRIDRL